MVNVPQFTAADRQIYEGMAAREILVWKNFLAAYGSEYDRFDYNIRVGDGAPIPQGTPENYARMIELSSKKRIDAVGYQGPQATLFEVKEYAQLSSLGQLMGYFVLYQKSFPDQPVPKLQLVANRLSPDFEAVLKAHGIAYQLFATDFSILAGKR